MAAVEPSAEAAGALYPVLAEEDREAATHALAGLTPFVIDVTSPEVYAPGVEVFEVQDRVSAGQTAVHLIGYLDSEGKGVTGLEAAFDEYLRSCGGSLSVRYATDTMGQALSSTAPEVVNENYGAGGGVVLTIDREIQQAAEQAAARYFEKGAVVVLDVHTGEIPGHGKPAHPTIPPMWQRHWRTRTAADQPGHCFRTASAPPSRCWWQPPPLNRATPTTPMTAPAISRWRM